MPPTSKPQHVPADANSLASARHSVVWDERRASLDEKAVLALLLRGVRLHWVTGESTAPSWFAKVAHFASPDVGLLALHVATSVVPTFVPIVDGQTTDAQRSALVALGDCAPTHAPGTTPFNWGQYDAEHTSAARHVHVTAGAGTGKTWLLVQRVLFLLHTSEGLSPNHLTLVTFTREAAAELQRRLTGALATRARLTGDRRYLDWLLAASDLKVSTIHAFALELLRHNGEALGIAPTTKVGTLTRERERILHDRLGPHVGVDQPLDSLVGQRLFEFVRALTRAWEQAENLDVPLSKLDWGKASGTAIENTVQKLMQEILPLAEGDFEQTKHRLRTITMADFCRMLRTALANKHTLQTRAPLKHLFIDEFQDTDNAQIDLVATIAKLTAARLFVVGDVKQSIYRFRGAQATAFQSLEDRMRALEHEAAARFTLQRNYRSAPAVLGAISPRFEAWGSRGHLPYAPATDALMPTVAPLPGIDRVETTNVFPELTALVPKLVELRRGVPAGERMAVLVRTNREARQLHAACRRAQIASQLSVGGTLFRSEAAFDLAALVRALLHPHDPPSLAALCDSAYAPGGPLLHELVACNGNHQALATLYAKTPGVQHVRALAERLRTHPLLAVIHEAIELLEPARHHETEQFDSANSDELRAQAPDAGARYRRNLDRILSLVHERFRHDALSAYALLRWLDVQRSTNRTEDEPNADATKSSSTILIKTAHSAKGLEYHTVVVRLSTRSFVNEKAAEIVRIDPTTSPPRIGWKLNRKGGALCSPRFHELENIESGEALREEARLLYVALTRAKRRLVLCPQQAIRDVGTPTNWCSLLGAK